MRPGSGLMKAEEEEEEVDEEEEKVVDSIDGLYEALACVIY